MTLTSSSEHNLSSAAKGSGGSVREISSGIIIFRRSPRGIRFLLLYHGGGYWNFPKGKIEREERSFETALREVREETGLRPQDLRVLRNFRAHERYTFYRGKQKISKLVILYLAETRRSEIRVSHEHEGYGWFLYEEAKKTLGRFKENQQILSRAHTLLEQWQKRK